MVIDAAGFAAGPVLPIPGVERQITSGSGGRILTNAGCWSPDSEWLVYDVRSDAAGDVFDGDRIEAVHVETGEVRVLYRSQNGAHCGVVTHHPKHPLVVFILGPEHPTPDWLYGPNHRQGVVVDTRNPGVMTRLDARDLSVPGVAGALRGGTHVHVWDAAGDWLSFTYNDAVAEPLLRDIGISIPGYPVKVGQSHPRNHDGDWYSTLVTRTVTAPQPGSDEIHRANEEGWVGTNGYVKTDGSRQHRAIAFQGHVITASGQSISEVFVVDLPDQLDAEVTRSPRKMSAGRLGLLPGVHQRRLTRTADRQYPGIQGTRHWLRSSPDGSRIACLMKDDAGVSQIWTVSPATGEMRQLTHNVSDVSTAFSWSSDGRWIAHGLAGRVCLTNTTTGETRPVSNDPNAVDLTKSDQNHGESAAPNEAGDLRKEACVISPDGSRIAFVRSKTEGTGSTNQICVIHLKKKLSEW